jgi:hypothetical protein
MWQWIGYSLEFPHLSPVKTLSATVWFCLLSWCLHAIYYMKKYVCLLLFLGANATAWAQENTGLSKFYNSKVSLPFEISDDKRLSEEDIANKKEGWYVTGMPEASVDPIRGFGLGASAYIYNNKSRKDPFFEYTPYRTQIGVYARGARSGQLQGAVSVDLPFAFNTRWRLRADFMAESDPNGQYFGIGSQSLQHLQFTDKQTGRQVSNARYGAYAQNLARIRPGQSVLSPWGSADLNENESQGYTDRYYNEFDVSQFLYALAAERTFFEGRMRLMFGYQMLYVQVEAYDGKHARDAVSTAGTEVNAVQARTMLTEASQAAGDSYWKRHNIGGYKGGRIAMLQNGIMWDTRDLEPDPSRGIFAEYAQEISMPAVGSQFSFSKHLAQFMVFKQVLPSVLGRSVVAGRVGMGHIRGKHIPFTEVLNQWTSDYNGGISALGGVNSLRGYRTNRFTGMVTGWANVEWRTRLLQTDVLKQHLAFSIVPFYDAGSVWDSFKDVNMRYFRHSVGLGSRIAWNQATILRFDYARSREDAQFFFVFEHIF